MKLKIRFRLIIILFFSSLLFSFITVTYIIPKVIHAKLTQLPDKILNLTGYELSFTNIETHWQDWQIVANLKDVVIADNKKNITINISHLDIFRKSIFKANYITLTAQDYFSKVLKFDDINGALNKNNLSILIPKYNIAAKISAQDLLIDLDTINIDQVFNLLPDKIMSINLMNWIVNSLQKGSLVNSKLRLELKTSKWDFTTDLKNMTLDYAAGWSKLTDVNAKLNLNNNKLFIEAEKSSIFGQKINYLIASLDLNKLQELKITGNINSTLQQGLEFVQNSPLRDSIGSKLSDINVTNGKISLDLGLIIPLENKNSKTAIDGKLFIDNGQLHDQQKLMKINNFTGNINFTERELISDGLRTNIYINNILNNLNINTDLDISLNSSWGNDFYNTEIIAGTDIYPELITYQDNINNGQSLSIQIQKILNTKLYLKNKQIDKGHAIIADQINLWFKYAAIDHKLYLDGPMLQGEIKLPDDKAEEINLNFNYIDININNNINNNILIKNFINSINLNNIDRLLPINFRCKSFIFNKIKLDNLEIDLLPRSYGYDLANVSTNSPYLVLQGQGQWNMIADPFTQLAGSIQSNNIGKLLSTWNFNGSIDDGNGSLSYELKWPGDPFEFDLGRAKGHANLVINKGRLLGVDPGLGKIMNLFSLENIPKRLQLDFSDIVKKEFSFDSLESKFVIDQGILSTEQILVNGDSARIDLNGKIELDSKNLDLSMSVTTKVGTGLPVAAAIAAGNPAVGAVVWLADKATKSSISEITSYYYDVTGTWNAPIVTEKNKKDLN